MDKNNLTEQPLNYWEEASYMSALPRHGRIDISKSLFDRVSEIKGLTLTGYTFPTDDEPGSMRLIYEGEDFDVRFYEDEITFPDEFSRQGYLFTQRDLDAIKAADTALTIFMEFGPDSRKSYHLQLKLLRAAVPDLLAVYDESAERMICSGWVELATDSKVLPGATSLYSIQAIGGDDGEVWLHTHGLNRCGFHELEVLDSDAENMYNHTYVISTVASRMIDRSDGCGEPESCCLIGMFNDKSPILATYVSWTNALAEYPDNLTVGGIDDRKDSHNGKTAVIFLIDSDDNDEENLRIVKVTDANDRLDNNPLLFITDDETERMRDLARERFGLVKYMATKGCDIIIKIGLVTDSGDSNDSLEHIWFRFKEFDGDRFKGELTQEPYDVAAMHEGDEAWFTIDDVTDWKIFLDDMTVTPDTAYLLV